LQIHHSIFSPERKDKAVKITKPELFALLFTWTLLVFLGGVYLGRTTERGLITISTSSVSPVTSVLEDSLETEEAAEAAASTEASAEASPEAGKLNLNTATLEELETLPEVGPVLAQRILDFREEYGGFIVVEELLEVPGIGDKTYEAIQNLVDVRD
jgi:competence ComEA-like helix-hairpin-helix protein